MCQFIIKNIGKFFEILLQPNEDPARLQWQYRAQKLLVLCIKQIFASPSPIAIPMRMIETFTSIDAINRHIPVGSNEQQVVKFLKRLFSFMIDQNYFRNVKKMLYEKIPENTYDDVTTRPHNELSRVLLELIERPLKLVNTFSADPSFDSKILSSFISEILTKDFNSTISNFVVPSLGAQSDFPFIKLIRFLHDVYVLRNEESKSAGDINMDNNNGEIPQSHKNVKFNCYLLYSILKLDPKFLDDLINQNYLSQYLVVIGAMIGHIGKLPKQTQLVSFTNFDDDDAAQELSDSDDETGDEDEEMQPQFERLILCDTITLLNEANRVARIVKNIDGVLHVPQVVQSLCQITHNLMIYNRAAISEYR